MVQKQITHAIIGLGNPGKAYQSSRHNIGFLIIDHLISQFPVSEVRIECLSLTWQASLEVDRQILLAKPATFMNHSGQAVAQLVQRYQLNASQLLIVHDDLDLPFQQVRFKNKGQSGGHRGLDSIIQYLHTDEFTRLKVGIGRPGSSDEAVDYVLSSFSRTEQKSLHEELVYIKEAIEIWIEHGFHQAANRFNRKISVDDD